jgi:hypothetical protein
MYSNVKFYDDIGFGFSNYLTTWWIKKTSPRWGEISPVRTFDTSKSFGISDY